MKRVVLFSIFFFTILLSAFSQESADSAVSKSQAIPAEMLAMVSTLTPIAAPVEAPIEEIDTVQVDSVVAAPTTRMLRQISSPRVKRSWFAVPIAFYQEETSVGFGATGGYYFKSNSLDKISSISGSIIYTLYNQAKLNVNPRFFLAHDKVYLTGNFNLRYYPDHYYGIGNGDDRMVDEIYTSESYEIKVEPFYLFNDDIMAGLYFGARGERLLLHDSVSAVVPDLRARFGSAGWDPYFVWGLGAQFAYDTRDNQFYPQKFSNFLKFSCITYQQALGSSFSFTQLKLDFRQYIPTWVGQVFAWQFYFDTTLGNNGTTYNQVPFQLLPTLGGSDRLRGFRERKYTDNTSFGLQMEYRIPIYRRLKATVFCSVGDVFDIYKPEIHKVKVGYGAGLRCRLNDARVNLRLDLTGNNYGEFKFYITATEAF